jgi:hypothetical protein
MTDLSIPPGDPEPVGDSFEDEIRQAQAFERKLLYRGLLSAAVVVVVIVVRTLFFA